MEAKDTVTFECHCEDPFSSAWGVEIHRADCLVYNQGKRDQAPISFKVGYKEGIVDALRNNKP